MTATQTLIDVDRATATGEPLVDRLVGKADVERLTNLSRWTIDRLESGGEFPTRKQITPNRVGWLLSEVTEWIKSRPGPN